MTFFPDGEISMLLAIPISLITACLAVADPLPDIDSLARLVSGLQSDLKDVEFIYEGGFKTTSPREDERPMTWTFQGRFAYRSDMSIYADIYRDFPDINQPMRRTVLGFLSPEYKLETLEFRPDLDKIPTQPKISRSGIVSLERDDVPLRFWLTPVLLCLLRDTGGYRTSNQFLYECLGWEDESGRRCLKIKLSSAIQVRNHPAQEVTYWLDMERSGTPIRRDEYVHGDLWVRTEGIKLATVKIGDGRSFWFPMRGNYLSYLTGDSTKDKRMETSSRPVVEQSYSVLNDSVSINRDLPDKRFTVNWRAPSETDSLSGVHSRFDMERRKSRESISRSQVETAIEKADGQKHYLEASAPSRERISFTMIASIVLFSIGIISLCLYWFIRRNS